MSHKCLLVHKGGGVRNMIEYDEYMFEGHGLSNEPPPTTHAIRCHLKPQCEPDARNTDSCKKISDVKNHPQPHCYEVGIQANEFLGPNRLESGTL